MIDRTMQEIEQRLQDLEHADPGRKQELQSLFRELRSEIQMISGSRSEHAESIARFANLSAHEALRRERDPKLKELSLEGLRRSVEEMEVEHPALVRVVNTICVTLSNIGI